MATIEETLVAIESPSRRPTTTIGIFFYLAVVDVVDVVDIIVLLFSFLECFGAEPIDIFGLTLLRFNRSKVEIKATKISNNRRRIHQSV